MKKYTAEERKEIHKQLVAAKKRLLARHPILDGYELHKTRYICVAIALAASPRGYATLDRFIACRMIQNRLRNFDSVEVWLRYKVGIDLSIVTFNEIQKYRHRWLDALIEEFSK